MGFLLSEDNLDKEFEVLVKLLRIKGGSHKMLTNSVDLGLHLKVFGLDAHVVSAVELVKNL